MTREHCSAHGATERASVMACGQATWLILAVVFLCSHVATAATYTVQPDGGGDYATIQAAVNACADHDVIELTDGTFSGAGNVNVNYLGKILTIQSQNDDPEACMVDCGGSARAFLFISDETSATLRGIKIVDAAPATGYGGAIQCGKPGVPPITDPHFGSPIIINCIFEDCVSDRGGAIAIDAGSAPNLYGCTFTDNGSYAFYTCEQGGAIYVRDSAPVIDSCTFVDNTSSSLGGAICLETSDASIQNCAFAGNQSFSGGAVCGNGAYLDLDNCLFDANTSTNGGGVWLSGLYASPSDIDTCTFLRNVADYGGGMLYKTYTLDPSLLQSCTFYGNVAEHGSGLRIEDSGHLQVDNTIIAMGLLGRAVGSTGTVSVTLDCCDVYGNEGGDWSGCIAGQDGDPDNISLYPGFCDPAGDDLTLRDISPCLPYSAPNPDCDLIGAWPQGCSGPLVHAVCPDSSGDFLTIQAAIDGAAYGDTVSLCDGTFTGDGNRDLDFGGKAIAVRSESGNPEACIIDCQASEGDPHRGFHFHSAEGSGSLVEGLTVTGGFATGAIGITGGGVLIEDASPRFRDCVFSYNQTVAGWGGQGGGVHCSGASIMPNLLRCRFSHNTSYDHGGGFSNIGGDPLLTDCTFEFNTSAAHHGGGVGSMGGNVILTRCLFNQNGAFDRGGGLSSFDTSIQLDSCTFDRNTTSGSGGGFDCASGTATITSCTFYRNSSSSGSGIRFEDASVGSIHNTIVSFGEIGEGIACGSGMPAMTCCDVYQNAGGDYVGCITTLNGVGGNICLDPEFCDPENGDFTITAASPCAPFTEPNPGCALIGAWPATCVMPIDFEPWQDLTETFEGDAVWTDLDQDGYPELAICGETDTGVVTEIYWNTAGTLTLHQSLTGIHNESGNALAWGDYNGDDCPDLALAGVTETSDRVAEIWTNDGAGNFSLDTSQSLTGVGGASVAWGDCDNDGDLDLYLQGHDGSSRIAKLYLNHSGGTLTEAVGLSLTGLSAGSVAWGDYDNDGDLDLVACGGDGSQPRLIIYENDPPGTLVDSGGHGIPGAGLGDVEWGDYDNDGDLDLAVTGNEYAVPSNLPRSKIYQNNGGVFTEFADLLNVYRSGCAWGDYDNDGDLDVAFCGSTSGGSYRTRIFENSGAGFTLAFDDLAGAHRGSVTFADADDDGDLDFLVGGGTPATTFTKLYRNTCSTQNQAPAAPTVLSGQMVRGLRLSWAGASDDKTPPAGLYYSLGVGTHPDSLDVCPGGYGTPLLGNVQQATSVVLDVPYGTYYWRVRTIDSGLRASDWSAVQAVSVGGTPSAWYFDDEVPLLGWGSPMPYWERMDSGPLWKSVEQDLDPDHPYFACTGPMDANLSGYRFVAEIWFANNYAGPSDLVTVELRKGGPGDEGVLLAADSDRIVNVRPARRYLFDFGAIADLVLSGESLIVKVVYDAEQVGNTHIYWDGETCPSALRLGSPALRDLVVCEPQGGANPSHPPTYWYDVTPGGAGRCDFHVQVLDSVPGHYGNVSLPAPSWQFAVHKVGQQWWASWWDPDCQNPITGTYRFQFDNAGQRAWGFWRTSIGGSSDPYYMTVDLSGLHFEDLYGLGFMVHVPTVEVTQVGDRNETPAPAFRLEANVPNPFNPRTEISYAIPGAGGAERVSLRIYDLTGDLVRTLVEADQPAGRYTVLWNGSDDGGAPVASGVYLYRLQCGKRQQSRKMLLVR